jgi:hypothetical protein
MFHVAVSVAILAQVAFPHEILFTVVAAEPWHSWTSWRDSYVFLHCLGTSVQTLLFDFYLLQFSPGFLDRLLCTGVAVTSRFG